MSEIPLISSILIFSGVLLYVSLLLKAFLKKKEGQRVQNIQENYMQPLSFKGVPDTNFSHSGAFDKASTGYRDTTHSTSQSILNILSTLEAVSIEDLMAKLSDRSKDFIVEALKSLEREGLIEVNAGMIILTDKAAKNILSLSEKRLEKGV